MTTKRRGREKLHFLKPRPHPLVDDRWVGKYAAPWAAALSELRRDIEEDPLEKVFKIYIKTGPERLAGHLGDRAGRRFVPAYGDA